MKIDIKKGGQILKQFPHINELMKNGIQERNGKKYYTGYAYNTLYDWDQYFESILQILVGWDSEFIKNGVTLFLDEMKTDGLISRHIPTHPIMYKEHCKPFLAQIALLVIDNYNESDWILNDEYFCKLEKYLQYWLNEMDQDKNGLSEWISAPHSGMDNQHERAGYWDDFFCEGVDLNSYLVLELKAFSKLALLKKDESKYILYNTIANEKAKLINLLMWDKSDNFYYDLNAKVRYGKDSCKFIPLGSKLNEMLNTEVIKVKSVSGFMPLFAGISTAKQAKKLVEEHLLNINEFWTSFPVPALAKSEEFYLQNSMPLDLGCNWRATVWVPTNIMLILGLKKYGYSVIANALILKTKELISLSGDREYYNSENGSGNGLKPFWGWSLLAYFLDCLEV